MENIFDRFLHDNDFDQLNNMVRWNGMNRIKDETVAHHSFIVSVFSRVLAQEIFTGILFSDMKIKLDVVTYALFHDYDEMFTGDVLHGLKYNPYNGPEIRNSIDDYLKYKIKDKFKNGSKTDVMFQDTMLKNFATFISELVKVADWLSMYFYLYKEMELGNKGLDKTRQYCIKGIKNSVDTVVSSLNKQTVYEVNLEILNQIKNISYE